MENKSLLSLIDEFQEILLYSIPVAAILFFLPLTSEFFQFNKQIFLIIASSIGLIAWSVKTIKLQKLSIVRSPLDLGIGLLFLSAILSTVFSINKFSSLQGQYGRVFPNIFSAVALFALYYTLLSNIKNVKAIENTAKIAVFSAGASALVSLLSAFGVLQKIAQVAWLQVPFFSTTGSAVTLGIICGSLFGLGLAIAFNYINSKNYTQSILYLIPTLLMGIYVIYINAIGAWISFAVGLIILGSFVLSYGKEIIKQVDLVKVFSIAVVAILGLFSALFYLPSVNKMVNLNFVKPIESTLNMQTSWQITTGTLRDYPLVGTGLSTYLSDFTIYKPISFNESPLWTFRFYKPGNEFFRIFSEQGLVGIVSLIILVLALLKITLQSKLKEPNVLRTGLSAGILAAVAALMAYPANISLMMLILFMAVLFIGTEKELSRERVDEVVLSLSAIKQRFLSLGDASTSHQGVEKKEVLTYVFLGISILISIPILFAAQRSFTAEVYHKNALTYLSQGNLSDSYNNYINAITQNPFMDVYRRGYSDVNLLIFANLLPQDNETELSEQDTQYLQQIANQATREIRIATENLNPLSVFNWEQRARLYNQLSSLDPNANQFALEATQRALQLDPLNPVLRVGSRDVVGLGGLYYAMQDYQSAAITFAEAIQLKRDFANAYFNLSLAQAQLQSWDASISNMEIVLRLVPQDSPDYQVAKDSLETLEKAKIEANNAEAENVAGTQTEQPAPQPQPAPQQAQPEPKAAPVEEEPKANEGETTEAE